MKKGTDVADSKGTVKLLLEVGFMFLSVEIEAQMDPLKPRLHGI